MLCYLTCIGYLGSKAVCKKFSAIKFVNLFSALTLSKTSSSSSPLIYYISSLSIDSISGFFYSVFLIESFIVSIIHVY